MFYLGDGTVGKTSLLTAYMGNGFVEDYTPTVVDVYSVNLRIGEEVVTLEIHDTAGQETFGEIRNAHLQAAEFVIICYSCDSLVSFQNIEAKWVPEVKALNQRPGYIFVGNKKDLVSANQHIVVPFQVATNLGRKLKAHEVVECSAKLFCEIGRGDVGNVERVFRSALSAGYRGRGYRNKTNCCLLL